MEFHCYNYLYQGSLSRDEVVRDYLRLCVRYENCIPNTKYVVQQMLQVIEVFLFKLSGFVK